MVVDNNGKRTVNTSDKDTYATRDVTPRNYRTSKTLPKYSTPTRIRTPDNLKTNRTTTIYRKPNEKSVESPRYTKKDQNGEVRKFQSYLLELERYKSYSTKKDDNAIEVRDDVECDNKLPNYLKNDSEVSRQHIPTKPYFNIMGVRSKTSTDERDKNEPVNKSDVALHHFRPDDDFSLTEEKDTKKEKAKLDKGVDSPKNDDSLRNTCETNHEDVKAPIDSIKYQGEIKEDKNLERDTNFLTKDVSWLSSNTTPSDTNILKKSVILQKQPETCSEGEINVGTRNEPEFNNLDESEESHMALAKQDKLDEDEDEKIRIQNSLLHPFTPNEDCTSNEYQENNIALEKEVGLEEKQSKQEIPSHPFRPDENFCYDGEEHAHAGKDVRYVIDIGSSSNSCDLSKTDVIENLLKKWDGNDSNMELTATDKELDISIDNIDSQSTFDEQAVEARDDTVVKLHWESTLSEKQNIEDKVEASHTTDIESFESGNESDVTESIETIKEIGTQTSHYSLTIESSTQTDFYEVSKEISTQTDLYEISKEVSVQTDFIEISRENFSQTDLINPEMELIERNLELELQLAESKTKYELLLASSTTEKETSMQRLKVVEQALSDANTRTEEETNAFKTVLEELSRHREIHRLRTRELEQMLVNSNLKVEELSAEKEVNALRICELEQLLIESNNNIEQVKEEFQINHDVQMMEVMNTNRTYADKIADLEQSIDEVRTNLNEEIEISKIQNGIRLKEEMNTSKRHMDRIAQLEKSIEDVRACLKEDNEVSQVEHEVLIKQLMEDKQQCLDQIADLQKSVDDSTSLKEEVELHLKEKNKQINELIEEKRICNDEILELKDSLTSANEKLENKSMDHIITLTGQVTNFNNMLNDKSKELEIASKEIGSLKQLLAVKEETIEILTQESAALEKNYSQTKLHCDQQDEKLKRLMEERGQLEMQVCKIQKMTTESMMTNQEKLTSTIKELSGCKELISKLRTEIDERKSAIESVVLNVKRIYDAVTKEKGETSDNANHSVGDMIREIASVNHEKDNKIKVLQAHIEAIKCSLNVEEDNSQKLWELISSLESELKQSTSKADDLSNKVSMLQTLVIDKNDELMTLNEVIDLQEITLYSLEKLAIDKLTIASELERVLIDAKKENEENKERCKEHIIKIAKLEEEINSTAKHFSKNAKKNDSYESLIDNLRCLVTERESEIRDLAKRLDAELSTKEKSIEEVEFTMNRKVEQISRDALERNVFMEGQIEKLRMKLDEACNKNYKNETQITFFKTELGQRDAQLKNLNAKLAFVVKNSSSKIEENEKLLKKLEQSLKKAYNELKNLEDQLSVATKERDDAQESLADKEEVQNELRIIINKLNSENQSLSDKLHQYDEQLNKKLQDAGASISTMKGFFSSLEAMISEKDKKISEISEELVGMKSMYEEQTKLSEEDKKAYQSILEEQKVLQVAYDKNKQENSAIVMQLRNAMQELSAKLVESRCFSDSMVKKTFDMQSAIDEVNRDLKKSKEVIQKQDKVIEELKARKSAQKQSSATTMKEINI